MLIFAFLFLASSSCTDKATFTIINSTYPFALESLPYSTDFLSEVLSSRIVSLHYNHHHLAYLTKLNSYIANNPDFNTTFLSELCKQGSGYAGLEKYAGGLYNHYLYWWTLTATECATGSPTGKLLTKIQNKWGDFTSFVTEWENSSNSVFGNGWTWLCVNTAANLEIRTTGFQLNPLITSASNLCYPILGIDLWEHAYYLTYTSSREDYISNFWEIVDWEVVSYFYETFASKLLPVPF